MNKNKTTTVRAMMCFDTQKPEEIRRILDHHMEYLIDMDDNRDIIQTVYGAYSYEINSKHDAPKLHMLAVLLDDILGENEPSDEDLDYDDNAIAVYDELHNLKKAMENMGI